MPKKTTIVPLIGYARVSTQGQDGVRAPQRLRLHIATNP
jgi:DNA invertase Pin-like site-specific DNA recombinase